MTAAPRRLHDRLRGAEQTPQRDLVRQAAVDFARDPVPIGGTMLLPQRFSVHPSVPAQDHGRVHRAGEGQARHLAVRLVGTGASPHMSGELLKYMAGYRYPARAYRGGAPAMADLVPGRVSAMFDNLTGSIEQIRAGHESAPLGVSSAVRSPALPGRPERSARPCTGYLVDVWHGIVAPKGTPAEIVALLNKTLNAVLAVAARWWRVSPELGARRLADPRPARPSARTLPATSEKWAKLIRAGRTSSRNDPG